MCRCCILLVGIQLLLILWLIVVHVIFLLVRVFCAIYIFVIFLSYFSHCCFVADRIYMGDGAVSRDGVVIADDSSVQLRRSSSFIDDYFGDVATPVHLHIVPLLSFRSSC